MEVRWWGWRMEKVDAVGLSAHQTVVSETQPSTTSCQVCPVPLRHEEGKDSPTDPSAGKPELLINEHHSKIRLEIL